MLRQTGTLLDMDYDLLVRDKSLKWRILLKRILLLSLKISVCLFLVLFVVVPFIFKHCYPLQRSLVFLNFVHNPKYATFDAPQKHEIDGVHNRYVRTPDNMVLGLWQILPDKLDWKKYGNEGDLDAVLDNGQPVMLYAHGNSGHRAVSHRIELYKVLRKKYHVIAFDYRSFGDSTYTDPTETGLVEDTKYMFLWLKNRTQSPIIVWGHSLGTGVSTHALHDLYLENVQPAGVVLECPFTNMKDEVRLHRFSLIFRFLPWFDYTFSQPMYENGLRFESDVHIKYVNAPILILHAEDDSVIPISLGYKLFEIAREFNKRVNFVKFEHSYGFGHRYICRSNELPKIIESFVNSTAQY